MLCIRIIPQLQAFLHMLVAIAQLTADWQLKLAYT